MNIEWNGEGLPPAGCLVKVLNPNGYTLEYGHAVVGNVCEVATTYKKPATDVEMVVVINGGIGYCFRLEMIFPIITERQSCINEMVKCINDGHASSSIEQARIACTRLYDAFDIEEKP